jgi:hypothetical protein
MNEARALTNRTAHFETDLDPFARALVVGWEELVVTPRRTGGLKY